MAIRQKPTSRSNRPTKNSAKSSDTSEDFLELWVKEPPSGSTLIKELSKLPSPYTTELDSELSSETRMLLRMRRSQFKETKNPIFAMEAFLVARDGGLFPPIWVLNWLGEAFRRFHAAQGKQSLEKILGLVPGKGQSPIFRKLLEDQRDEMLCLDVWRLMTLFNTSLEAASAMVAARLNETPHWNTSPYELHSLSEKTIADRYTKKWKNLFNDPRMRHEFLCSWTKAMADEFLSRFPPHSYNPQDIKPTLIK